MDDRPSTGKTGVLYIVATPIGNVKDITLRALEILKGVDLIAAEDTRQTGKLLARHEIRKPLVSCHEHNERKKASALLARLQRGENIALVTDAGTPGISDPGFILVREAAALGITVHAVPGPSAVIAALSVSGLPTDTYTFIGFLPKKTNERRRRLKKLADHPRTLVFYESPRRIISLIDAMADIFSDRSAVLCREMTKKYEEILRGTLTDLWKTLSAKTVVKGECTLIVAGNTMDHGVSDHKLEQILTARLADSGNRLSQVVREVSESLHLNRRHVYSKALSIAKAIDTTDGANNDANRKGRIIQIRHNEK